MISETEFRRLFDEYFDAMRGFIFYRCGDAELASDMTQELFMKVWEKRKQFVGGKLKPLLYKMANDMIISNYRKNAVRQGFEKSMEDTNALSRSPEEELAFKELSSLYAKALERMPETQRTVFLMSRNDELKYAEIAGRLSISVKAVEKRMSAALQFLRDELL